MSLTTKQLTEAVAAQLEWLGHRGFQYLGSKQQFRRKDADGYSYITLNSVTHNRVDYHLAFYLGLRADALESEIRRVRGDSLDLTHDDRSLLHYSVNTGPTSVGWKQPLMGTWTLRDISELDSIVVPMQKYLKNVALPFLDENRTAEDVRACLLQYPSHTQNPKPWRQILGADVLNGDCARLESDFEALAIRYARFVPHLRSDFEDFYHAARQTLRRNVRPTHSDQHHD